MLVVEGKDMPRISCFRRQVTPNTDDRLCLCPADCGPLRIRGHKVPSSNTCFPQMVHATPGTHVRLCRVAHGHRLLQGGTGNGNRLRFSLMPSGYGPCFPSSSRTTMDLA